MQWQAYLETNRIYNHLFLSTVLPLGSTVVYGATVNIQNLSTNQVSATKSGFPFHFFQPAFYILCNYKEYLVLIFLCTLQESSILQELVLIPLPQQIKMRSDYLQSMLSVTLHPSHKSQGLET